VIRRVLLVMLVLAAGAVFVGALYWGLLNTPEANPITLGLSAFIVVTMLTAAGVTVNTAIVVAQGVPVREGLRRAPRGIGWFLVAIVPLVVAWIAIVRGDRWMADHQGELNAWFIARLGWADISRLLQTEVWTSRWLRWTVLPLAACHIAWRSARGAHRMAASRVSLAHVARRCCRVRPALRAALAADGMAAGSAADVDRADSGGIAARGFHPACARRRRDHGPDRDGRSPTRSYAAGSGATWRRVGKRPRP
jgi:hypothetical protein